MPQQDRQRAVTAVLATAIGSVVAAAVVQAASVVLPNIDIADLFEGEGFAGFVAMAIVTIIWMLLTVMALLVGMFVLPATSVAIMLRWVGADRIAWTVAGGLALWYGTGLFFEAQGADVDVLVLVPFAFVAARVAVEATRRWSPRRDSNP